MGELEGKVALVTGGARGIGAAACRALAGAGARVAVNYYKSVRQARALVSEIGGKGRAAAFRCDVSSWADCRRMVAGIVKRFGRLDILVNNASYASAAGWKVDIAGLPLREWERTIAVDLRGTLLCTKAAVPRMRRGGWGAIVNMASAAALAGDSDTLLFNMAKMGVVGLTRSLAPALAPAIRVNAVAPGSARTRWLREWAVTRAEERDILRSIPLGRIAEPDEVAGAILFLASPRSAFITGQTLVVDGGSLRT